MRRLARLSFSTAAALSHPCAPVHADVLRAVLSKLPPGALVTADQLRSVMGLWSRDLCGLPLKELGGSWERALHITLGSSTTQTRQDGSTRQVYALPPTSRWRDPRPAPAPSTRCLGALVEGSTTWLTNDPEACDDLIGECGFESAEVLGFDLEWTPAMVRGQAVSIALLQLATREHCLLLRVGEMAQIAPHGVPPRLRRLLETHPPYKVGRGIGDDAKLVRSQMGVDMRRESAGLVELPGRDSLKTLARRYASFPLPPTLGSPLTNWDARDLPRAALTYASLDALVAADVYGRMPQQPPGSVTTPKKAREAKPRAAREHYIEAIASPAEQAAARGKRAARRRRQQRNSAADDW